MKKSIVMIAMVALLLPVFSCNKKTNYKPTGPSDDQNLNGTWIISDYTQIRLGRDSIILNEGWTMDSTSIGSHQRWIHPTDSLFTLLTNESDTTWLHYAYIGDGYCCNVQTININADSYLTGATISINALDYLIIEHAEDGDPEYRYRVDVEVMQRYNGCYEYYRFFKRTND